MAVVVAVLGAPGSARAALAPQGAAALDWIAAELDANSGTLPSSFDPATTDWGLTADAVLALAAGGRGADAGVAAAAITANATSYVTGADFGSPDDRYAGALAKLLLVVLVTGGDPASVPGIDPEAALRARMVTEGAQAGRFSDASDFGDFSNGIGQALALLALERTGTGLPPEAVGFLLAQQCPAGGFRVSYETGDTCADDAAISVDATAFAVMALAAVPATGATTSALAGAGAWLASVQGADGSFGANANSTGLAGSALRALGSVEESEAAAQALLALQLDTGPEAGAIAFDAAARSAIAAGEVGDRDQLRRATTQGVLGLGLSPYGSIGRSGPFDLSQTTTAPSTTAPSTTAPSTTAPSTTAPSTTAPSTTAPTTTTTDDPQALVLTGSSTSRLALVAATLVVMGGLIWLGGSSRRAHRHPM